MGTKRVHERKHSPYMYTRGWTYKTRHPPRGGQKGKWPKPEKAAPSIRLESAGVNSKEWVANKGARVGTRPRVKGHKGLG